MVDLGLSPGKVIVGPSAEVRTLESFLNGLSRDRHPEVQRAALAVLRRIELAAPLSARSFDRVYYEVLHQELLLPSCFRRAEWRAVKDLSVTVYHALLRDLRDKVQRRHHSQAGTTEPRDAHHECYAASVRP